MQRCEVDTVCDDQFWVIIILPYSFFSPIRYYINEDKLNYNKVDK